MVKSEGTVNIPRTTATGSVPPWSDGLLAPAPRGSHRGNGDEDAHIQKALNTAQVAVVARTDKEAISRSKDSATRLAAAMEGIRASAESASVVIQEINTIALTTDTLAADAAVKASNVGAAGRGFSVLAREMGDLAKRSLAAAAKMQEIVKSATVSISSADAESELAKKEFNEAIRDINAMARQTSYLAMNAAVQAAHIEEAGRGFESFTEETHRLSVSTKDAALRTEGLIRSSVELAQNGENMSREIDGSLLEISCQALDTGIEDDLLMQ